jgi:hypothetical protein
MSQWRRLQLIINHASFGYQLYNALGPANPRQL